MNFTYVYILKSESWTDKYYVGFTDDMKARISLHNSGKVQATRPYRPWKIKNYFAFDSEEKAVKFEKYLKSHSGRAFSEKHF